jgi:hypothetical protein
MTRSTLVLVILIGWLLIAIPLAVHLEFRDVSRGIDCGPDGSSALNGSACIDREPVTFP